MNPIIAFVTFPFRFVADAVDQRPSASQIKTHLNRQEVFFTETPSGVTVGLKCSGTEICSEHVAAMKIEDDQSLRSAFKQGVQVGATLVTDEVSDITRSKIRAQSKDLAAAKAASEEALARSAEPIAI